MATPYVASLRREDEEKESRAYNRGKRGSVSFQPQLSFYSASVNGTDFEETPDEKDGELPQIERHWWQWLVENEQARKVFRVISVLNLIVLGLSIPFYDISEESNSSNLRIQFSIITCLDFLLALAYTFHMFLRLRYSIFIRSHHSEQREITYERERLTNYTDCIRISTVFGVMVAMWYSVAIGIYRSVHIQIFWAFYIGFLPRAILSITSVIKLFLPLKVDSSALEQLKKILKWKQLCMVTLFYFIFVFLFALIGVHVIGGLDYICFYNDSNKSVVPAIPIIHCNPNIEGGPYNCPSPTTNTSQPLFCQPYSNNHNIDFNYRSRVYYGQYRTILDALYAVYEASTLELWSFMMYNAIDGNNIYSASIFYVFIVVFIVILLQQSIFLVVIIESFADLRSQSSIGSSGQSTSQKQTNKPLTVLFLQSGSETKLRLQHREEHTSKRFIQKYSKILVKMEKFFLIFVFLDAIIVSLKSANYPNNTKDTWKIVLQSWQVFVSVVFVVEVIILFFFHLYHGQWRLFFKRPYYLCLCVLAFGGLIAGIPYRYFYDPLYPANGLAIFQALRFPRLVRTFDSLKEFLLKLMGNKRVPCLILVTIAIIIWLALINAQIFGYQNDFTPDCQNVASGHFNNFLVAFKATFQLVLNEAWTDITSEVMCGSSYWAVTNLYFIIIHLFSSLIFLNFFGAVILDNLEYDEEEQRKKLEEIKEKEAESEKVPPHLTIFKKLNNQPKRLRPPGTGLNDPNLEELDVRRFFESGNTPVSGDLGFHDYNVAPHVPSQQPPPIQKEDGMSQLRQLSLVSTDNDDFLPSSSTAALQGKYLSITAILNYIKLWRQYAEEESTKTPRASQLNYIFDRSERTHSKGGNTKTRSEYDEYRERHRFFDSVLFCMPPEHKVRRFCTWILTAQAKTPKYVLIELKSGQILTLFKARFSFIFKWIISQMPYFTWVIYFGLCFTIFVQLAELLIHTGKSQHYYLIITEIIYLVLMLSWLILRILSKGLFLNPHAAINSVWDILDWIFVIDSALLLILLPLWYSPIDHVRLIIYIPSLPKWVWCMMIIRSLRPLHIISILRSLRAVVRELLEGWKNLLKAGVVMFGFVFMFASLGVQLFAGTEINPLAFCNDPNVTNEADCIGEFEVKLRISREFLPNTNNSNVILVPRVWFPHARDFPFDNVPNAFVTLFELLTLEGWPEVRELFTDKSNPGAERANLYMAFYIHIYVFFAVNLGLQLFLGIVINNFNEHKPGHSFLLSVDQNRWVELMQRISLQRPYKLPQEPRDNYVRMWLYKKLTHHRYRIIPTIIIILSALTLIVPWRIELLTMEGANVLVSLSVIFNFYTILEMCLKLLAFGPGYFHSWRNFFDCCLAIVTMGYYIFVIIFFIMKSESVLLNLSYMALCLAILKCITILIKYSAMLNLLITVGSTILRSIPHIQVLLMIVICYSLLGVVLYSNIRTGEAIDYSLVNFKGSGQAVSALWRTITGEDWYQIMWDVAVSEPYCQESLRNCGNKIGSVFYFGSFIFIVSFVLLNIFIAVLLENFSIFYNDDDTNLSLSVIKDYKRKWHHFDTNAKGRITASRLKLLLRSLELQEFYSYSLEKPGQSRERIPRQLTSDPLLLWEMEEELHREVSTAVVKTPPTNNQSSEVHFSFFNVLKMLAYRCEDINTRLESQELYTREELETNIKIDVAEKCILKWLQKCVKPLVDWQREQSKPQEQNPEETKQPSSQASDRKRQLYSLHNMQSQLLAGPSWGKQPSLDTEDEEGLPESYRRSRLFQNLAVSDEQVDIAGLEEDSVVAKSYAKLAQTVNREMAEQRARAREWFQMQEEWMDKVKSDPNYFDDHL